MRAKTDFARVAASDRAFGSDPYVIRVSPCESGGQGRRRFLGILRGANALVVLDSGLNELERFETPESPTGLAVSPTGEVFVAGELSSRIARFRCAGGTVVPAGSVDVAGVHAIRDVAVGPEGVLYIVEEHDGRLIALGPAPIGGQAPPDVRVDSPLCHGPLHVLRVGDAVLVDCLLDHAIVIRRVDPQGFPMTRGELRIVRDGPMWGMDAIVDGSSLIVAAGGVEDHPLDRTQGSFGFIDSFASVYRVTQTAVTKVRDENTSALGTVTPKALKLSRRGGGELDLAVAGYGSDRFAILDVAGASPPRTFLAPPGSAMMERDPDGRYVIANPLLDAWIVADADRIVVVDAPPRASAVRSVDSRRGEVLFFTTRMAPWNKSDDRLSRFTCETCHFEGYVDGRVHHTGRADVHAVTKPLRGLFNNNPYFSRALDPDMTTMVNNEFRVAGANSGHDPWFSLSSGDAPWAAELFTDGETLSPEILRRGLMAFFMDFTHRPNPAVVGRTRWTAAERAGAQAFRDKCEGCHQARLVTNDASTRVPFGEWEKHVLTRQGAIVWARADYEKTGVLPYVNEAGARVVSLRRLYKKYPYFTNGSAKDLATVLDRSRLVDGRFMHDGAIGGTALSDSEKSQLLAFLDLL